ncbi:hypothetical protein [Ureaplasma canigenitalium]|uniref:hypothetical protein n=1 Tax=Ureaplasma canigenitalium TaxID=42092 RepID=UPI0004E0E428|nr:hypothetical protein [Ureaplasma canigenitalium]
MHILKSKNSDETPKLTLEQVNNEVDYIRMLKITEEEFNNQNIYRLIKRAYDDYLFFKEHPDASDTYSERLVRDEGNVFKIVDCKRSESNFVRVKEHMPFSYSKDYRFDIFYHLKSQCFNNLVEHFKPIFDKLDSLIYNNELPSFYLSGSVDSGKSYFVQSIVNTMSLEDFGDHTFAFVDMKSFVLMMVDLKINNERMVYEEIEKMHEDILKKVDILVLDNVGQESFNFDIQTEFFKRILDVRNKQNKVNIFISRYTLNSIGNIYLDQMINKKGKANQALIDEINKWLRIISKSVSMSLKLKVLPI